MQEPKSLRALLRSLISLSLCFAATVYLLPVLFALAVFHSTASLAKDQPFGKSQQLPILKNNDPYSFNLNT